MNRFWKLGLAVVAVLALAGAAVGFVAAQTGGEGGSTSGERPNFVARLAKNLGITEEELKAAIGDTELELLDEAVAEGRISEEKANLIRQRIEAGEGPLFPHLRPHPGLHHQGVGVVRQVAEFLGLEPQEIFEALKSGQSLAQVAEAQDVSADELKVFLLDELKGYLAQAVEKGRITQERADEIMANAPERIDELIDREGLPWGPHMRPPEGITPEMMPGGGFIEPVPEGAGPLF